MSSWYEKVSQENQYIQEAIQNHDFIKQLMDGSLSEDIFKFYIHQDSIYLSEYKRVLAQIGIKCVDAEDTQFFLSSATGIIDVENALHQVFLKDEPLETNPSPTCQLYTSYLTKMVTMETLEEGLAAVLPCFTIYQEVGDYILANQSKEIDNPYQNWINTYSGEAFANSVKQAIAITNKYAETASPERVEKMNVAFNKAAKLEWMFWDSAFKQEAWQI